MKTKSDDKARWFSGMLVVGALLLANLSCSGGGATGLADNGGMSGTGVSQGSIDSFGSIFVNGVEWQLGSASIEVDDDSSAGEAALRVGMVVTVRGNLDAGGATGSATSVIYDDSLEGPIDSDPMPVTMGGTEKSFEVLGRTVVVDAADTVFDGGAGFDFATIARDDVVEISGFDDGSGMLRATRVELKGTFPTLAEAELEGLVAGLMPNGNGTGDFLIGTIMVEYDLMTSFEGVTESALMDGDRVEVRGLLLAGGTSMIAAAEIELEDDDFEGEDVEDFEIEGLVSSFVSLADFRVSGVRVNASGVVPEPSGAVVANGVRVEVEGRLEAGVLKADEVEVEDAFENDVRIEAAISAIDPVARTVTLLGISVEIGGETELEDERDGKSNFGFDDLAVDDWLEVRGRTTGVAGVVLADKAERDDAGVDVRLRGPMSMLDRVTPAFSILEQPMPIDDALPTLYFDATGAQVSEAIFFADPGGVLDSDIVEVTDEDAAQLDALLEADTVEIEDD